MLQVSFHVFHENQKKEHYVLIYISFTFMSSQLIRIQTAKWISSS